MEKNKEKKNTEMEEMRELICKLVYKISDLRVLKKVLTYVNKMVIK